MFASDFMRWVGLFRAANPFEMGVTELGESGEEVGDESTMMGESKVELVVVGEESVDSEAVEMLSRGNRLSGRAVGSNKDGY